MPAAAPMQMPRTAWHAMPIDEVTHAVDSGPKGLTAEMAARRLDESGPNTLQVAKPPGPLALFWKQLSSPLIILLLIAAAISLLAQHPVDALVIGAVVLFNSVIGMVQEWRAERALEALRSLTAPRARVIRDGAVLDIDAADVVPGDLLVLETGDRVAADARLVDVVELSVDESALTGESEPVQKSTAVLADEAPLADQVNMVWRSTAITAGRGLGHVVETGMGTVIGQISTAVQETEREDTPLQKRLTKLGGYIGVASVGAATVVFGLGILRGFDPVEMLLFSIATAVSAIPEGLPAVITVVLAIGVQRMSGRNAVVRRLPAVETLGSTTVVCSDKTGTITRNQMTVSRLWTPDGAYEVEGDGFEPRGRVRIDGGDAIDTDAVMPRGLGALLEIGVLANNAVLRHDSDGWAVQGNPTDGALLVAARKAEVSADELGSAHERVDEIPFSSASKYMATLNQWGDDSRLLVKGAPERLLVASTHVQVGDVVSPMTEEWRSSIRAANAGLAAQALRVVAGAYRVMPAGAERADREMAESGLVFVGMWGLLDPPREEAIAAIGAAQRAGIRVVMITGDHATTAEAIARRVGIVQHDELTVDGAQLDELADEDLLSRVGKIAVYARVEPRHKLRIVTALKAQGDTVAMTGDGVNDAPALKAANIGIAMGVTGTEVAKEAADMVLADDNFATIIDAVEQGRVIFSNLRRAVAFLMTTSLGEVLTLVSALILGLPLPVTAVMILWINLITDGITGIPLGLEPKHADVLKRPPRPSGEGVLTRGTAARVGVLASITATGTLGLFVWELQTKDLAHAQTIAFTTLVAIEWFKSLTWRTSNESLLKVGLFTNRWLVYALAVAVPLQIAAVYTPLGQLAFGTVSLSADEWARLLVVSSVILIADEIGKLIRRRLRRRAPTGAVAESTASAESR